MKRIAALLLVCAMLLCLFSCTPTAGNDQPSSESKAPDNTTAVTPAASPAPTVLPCDLTVTGADQPQTEFAKEEIMAAAQKAGTADAWTISFDGIDPSLEEQGYAITVSGKTISITGGDTTGLMYGGLEVAEEIAMYGVEGVTPSSAAPRILNRGIKFNAPLDMRTPSYTDAGDAAQNNIESMWDMEFWKAQFDAMARARMNVFSLWNLNPFPSMVKVPEYPDVALDDVWRMTLELDSSYNGTATNMVREEHWQEGNYEVVKTMTIDEKITFWQEVMQYAADRGIDFYVVTWNIYTYGEQGKYGIDSDINNPVTRDYFRCCARELIKTYPLLAGIGVTAGENMKWEPGTEAANETWLWETYGMGINDALAEEPEREFTLYHRLHLTEFDMISEIWKDFKGTIDFSEKYSFAHMLSYTKPTFANETLEAMPEGDRLWMELRCDDSYSFRWGDADYMREYFAGMPVDQMRGYLLGADGYVLGREQSVVDPDLKGQLNIEKNWYLYNLVGRLGYDASLSDAYFRDLFAARYNEVDRSDADLLYDAMAMAGKIIPQVNWVFWMNTDAWYPEMCHTETRGYGYVEVKRWINADNTMPDAPTMSIKAYAQYLKDGEPETDLLTPPEAAANLRQWAEEVLKLVDDLESGRGEVSTLRQKEFWSTVTDQKAVACLGLFYAEKIEGVVALRRYNDTEDVSFRTEAVEHLTRSAEYWKQFAALFAQQYLPQQYGRIFEVLDPTALIENVEADITAAEKWKPRRY